MAEAGERPHLPALPFCIPEMKSHQGLQDRPAGQTGLGLIPQRVAKEGRETSFYSVGAVTVFLPGCRLDLKTAFPGVLSVGHAKVSWSQPLLKKYPWLSITCRNKVEPLNCVWPWGSGFWPHILLWFGQTHSLHFPNWTLNMHLIWGTFPPPVACSPEKIFSRSSLMTSFTQLSCS